MAPDANQEFLFFQIKRDNLKWIREMHNYNLKGSILVVDDEESICSLVCDYLANHEFECHKANSMESALSVLRANNVDCIVSDIKMPGLSGLDLLKKVMVEWPDIAVVLITGHADVNTAVTAMQEGAYDFISKPFQLEYITKSVFNALEKRKLKEELRNYQRNLEVLVEERTRQISEALQALKDSHTETIRILARAAEYRDDETGSHVMRISKYCELIAKGLNLPSEDVWMLTKASPLHDIGKIGIPDSILLKPDSLSQSEFEIMKRHPMIGKNIFKDTESNLLRVAEVIAFTHHEKWDGNGYPTGLKGEDIPLVGRITAIADVFDALTMKRCYKPAFTLEKSLEIMREGRGSHFDPKVLDIFLTKIDEVQEILTAYQE